VDVSPELEPFFEFTFINCFPICHYCGAEQEFASDSAPYSDEWYMDMAIAIRNANWVIPELQTAACAKCAASKGLKHNPRALSSRS